MSHASPPLQLAIEPLHRARRVTAGAAGEGTVPERDHCCRIVGCNPPAELVVGLRPVDVGLPAKPSPSERAVELQEGVFVEEDVSEVGLEVGDRGATWAWNS